MFTISSLRYICLKVLQKSRTETSDDPTPVKLSMELKEELV